MGIEFGAFGRAGGAPKPLVLIAGPCVIESEEHVHRMARGIREASLPVAAADGLRWTQAVSIWGAWMFAFAAAVFPVRAVIVEHRTQKPSAAVRLSGTLLAIAFAAALAAAGELPAGFVVAAAPLFTASAFIGLRPPAMKQMTRVGWTLMVAGALTAAAMTAAVHLS